MKIFITGATGLIGSALIKNLAAQRHNITILSRNIKSAEQKLGTQFSYCQSLESLTSFDGYDAIINLAGESIGNKRWSSRQRKKLLDSRLKITSKLVELIKKSETPPAVFISGSAVGYYGHKRRDVLIESTEPNDNFTHQLCQQWEDCSLEAKNGKTRICLLRTGIVLSLDGGMLPKIMTPFKLGLGSIMGSGNQYISWVHIEDMVNAICYLLSHSSAQGPFNVTSPKPVTNKIFSGILAKNLHRPCWFRIPAFILRLFLGKLSSLLLDSQRAIPKRLEDIGFSFKYDNIDKAFKSLLYRKQSTKG